MERPFKKPRVKKAKMENEEPREHRDIAKIDKTILDNFYKLVHAQTNVRLTAAASTFKILQAMKKNRKELFNENLNYCVDRLVAGLSSARALARQGYATLLLELLNEFQVSTDRLLSIANQKFGNVGKDATRDSLLGYFLLLSAILKSGNHKRGKSSEEYLEKMYKLLMNLVYTKSYFDFPVCSLLIDHYEQFYQPMFDHIPQHAFSSDPNLSAVQLLAIILCNKKEPIRELVNMDGPDLLNMCSVLKNERLQKRPLHPIFLEASKFIIHQAPKQFETFYKAFLFATFFKPNHNELASMGLELTAQLIVETESVEAINVLLGEHVVKLLILSLRNKTTLSKSCVEFFNNLGDYFGKSMKDKEANKIVVDQKQFTIIQRLTSSPGSLAFDRDSNSDCFEKLLNQSTPNVLKKQIERINLAVFRKPIKENRIPVLCSGIKQVSYICCRTQLIEDQPLKLKTVKQLLVNLFFERKPDAKIQAESPASQIFEIETNVKSMDLVRASLKNAYHAVLCHIVSTCNAPERIKLFDDLNKYCDALLQDKSISYIRADGDNNDENDLSNLWTGYMGTLESYKKFVKKNQDSRQLYPITTLFYFYGLQILEHQLDCKTQLEELQQSAKDSIEGDPKDGTWADILTDQILAILSATECSPWIRRLCDSVFGSLLPHISQTSIDLLCEAIKSPLDGEEDCSDEEDDMESGEEDEVAMETDDQQAQKGEEEGRDDEEEDAETSSDDDTSDDDSGDEMSIGSDIAEDAAENMEKTNDEEEESEEEYLDDDQMMKMDSVLADMFRLNRVGKRRRLDPSFKMRCLDLIKKVIVKKRNDKETIAKILETIIPIANASRKSPDTRPISEKINKMIPKTTQLKVT